jgi:integral membrane protein
MPSSPTPIRDRDRNSTLRVFCLIEAFTLLALVLVAVPLKHLASQPLGVSVMGPVHGLAFLSFCWRLAQSAAAKDIDASAAWRLLIAALVPFGGLYSWAALRRGSAR